MKKWLSSVAFVAIIAMTAACSSDEDVVGKTSIPGGETQVAGSTDVPQPTIVSPVLTPDNYTTTDAFPQLAYEHMIEIDVIPGDADHAIITTQAGIVYRFNLNDPTEMPTTFLDVSDRIIANRGKEEGLLGLAFPPDYEQSHRLYAYYSAGPPRQDTLSRFSATGAAADPASEQKLIAVDDPYDNHNGGGLGFGPDGYLYLGIGDGGSGGDPNGNGQNTNVLLGKILRIDVSGATHTIPADNPFASGGGAPEVFAYGLRNPWRISFDAATGDLWTGDVGQDGWEEVDRIENGKNYGWNRTEGFECFEPSTGCDRMGLTDPRAAYMHGENCSAVTGGYVYRGRSMPELNGYYIYADYCSGIVWAVNTTDSSDPIKLAETGLQIPGFWQDPTGELFLLTFENKVVKLARK